MLILSRQVNESIMIGEKDVELTIRSIRAKRVGLTVRLFALGGRVTFEDEFDIELNEGDQPIRLPGDVTCGIVHVGGDKARIGICAPKTTSVHRREVYDAIRRANRGDR